MYGGSKCFHFTREGGQNIFCSSERRLKIVILYSTYPLLLSYKWPTPNRTNILTRNIRIDRKYVCAKSLTLSPPLDIIFEWMSSNLISFKIYKDQCTRTNLKSINAILNFAISRENGICFIHPVILEILGWGMVKSKWC